MADIPFPESIKEHFDLFWILFLVVLALLAGVIGFIWSGVLKRISRLEANQQRVLKAIPNEALEKGLTLLCLEDCKACSNLILTANDVRELRDDIKGLKAAVLVLIFHAVDVPKEEKDRIAKGLI